MDLAELAITVVAVIVSQFVSGVFIAHTLSARFDEFRSAILRDVDELRGRVTRNESRIDGLRREPA